jgi:hypothetical protein
MSTRISYVRLYADAAGASHIERDLHIPLEPTNFVPPAPSIHVSPLQPATACAFLSVPIAYFGDWHPSPKRQWLFFLSGQMEFEVSDGTRFLGVPGSTVLLEDVLGQGHRSRVIGDEPAVMAAVQCERAAVAVGG